jgi:hypothetical protein
MVKLTIIRALGKLQSYLEDITYVDPMDYAGKFDDTFVLVGYKRATKNCPSYCVLYDSAYNAEGTSFTVSITHPIEGCTVGTVLPMKQTREYDFIKVATPTYDEWYADYKKKEKAYHKKRDLEDKKSKVV